MSLDRYKRELVKRLSRPTISRAIARSIVKDNLQLIERGCHYLSYVDLPTMTGILLRKHFRNG